jgi:uncharacterized protein (TIGR02246 family)
MKTRLLLALVGLTISFALPTSAQEQTAVDPETREQIEAIATQFVEAYNKHDAAALGALYTEDAIRMYDRMGGDVLVGREAIEKDFEGLFAASMPPLVRKTVQICSLDDWIVVISEYRGVVGMAGRFNEVISPCLRISRNTMAGWRSFS